MRRTLAAVLALSIAAPARAFKAAVQAAPQTRAQTPLVSLPQMPVTADPARATAVLVPAADVSLIAPPAKIDAPPELEAAPIRIGTAGQEGPATVDSETESLSEGLAKENPQRSVTGWRQWLGGLAMVSGLCGLAGCVSAPAPDSWASFTTRLPD